MSENIERESRETLQKYIALRDRIIAGDDAWESLADYFTEDAVYIDPAWGRVEGRDEIYKFMRDSMLGLEDWSFPEIWSMHDGHRIATMWEQRIGPKADGKRYTQPGFSIMYYATAGKFCYSLDMLNMTHVFEDMRALQWTPNGPINTPPKDPNRDWSLPSAWQHLEDRRDSGQ